MAGKRKKDGADPCESRGDPRTISGLPVAPTYSRRNLKRGADYDSQPGQFPFTRGIHRDMYRGKLWTMRQYAGFGSASETNARFRKLLREGGTGLSVAFDLPTQMGRDADHPLARGEVGRTGVSISSLADMQQLFAGIPLGTVSVSMTINATAAIILAFLLVAAEKQGVPWKELSGTVQNDVLKEYIARGTYIYPPKAALRIVTDVIEFCARRVPRWNTISISGYHIREAGSTAVQELAFTFADAESYVEAALERGMPIDSFAPRLAFFFNCHNNFLEEIAKFRAARRIWAGLMKKRFGAKDPRSMMLRFHTQTAGSSLTAQQPYNNVVRTTIQALAAVLGGTQSLHTNAFDEALALPTEASAALALRTQQIIAFESGVAESVDPLGGSYLIESWTDRLESEALALLERVRRQGGMARAIESGFPQREIENSAFEHQMRIENGELVIVGVNRFTDSDQGVPELHMLEGGIEQRQRRAIQRFRKRRNQAAVESALAGLERGSRGRGNTLELAVNAVRAGCTLGEISAVWRSVFGEFRI